MIRVAVFCFLALFSFSCVSGCAPLIVGAAVGGVGGYAISKDTVQGDTDKPYESLWNAAITVSRIRGTIKQEDAMRGYIDFNIEAGRVWIRLIRLTHSTTRIRISARKFHLPDLSTAQDLYTKIMDEAR